MADAIKPTQGAAVEPEPLVHAVFEPTTGTWQYVVADALSRAAVIIDPVLDFDPGSSRVSTESADALLALVRGEGYRVEKLLETHAHADHLTASAYLRSRLPLEEESKGEGEATAGDKSGAAVRPQMGIGKHIVQVQRTVAARYGVPEAECGPDAFDLLFDDGDEFAIGGLTARVMYLPGHTPDHIGYMIGANVFCGDSLFNHDVGSARCDFPGGDAAALFASARRLLALPDQVCIWTGHDYPPGAGKGGGGSSTTATAARAEPLACTTVARQRRENVHLGDGASEADFVAWRRGRDAGLGEPRLLHQALQVNVRAGRLPGMLRVPPKLPHGVVEW